MTISEVCGDVDFWGWKNGKEERIIDSSGKVFYLKFETSGIFRSGQFPDKVERFADLTEVKTMMKKAAATHHGIIDDLNELLVAIDDSKSIQEIFELCNKYF